MVITGNSIQKGQLGQPGFPVPGNPGLPMPDSRGPVIFAQNAKFSKKAQRRLAALLIGPISNQGRYGVPGIPVPGNPGLPLSGSDFPLASIASRRKLGFVSRAVGGNKNSKLGSMNVMTIIRGAGMRLPQAAFGLAGLGTMIDAGYTDDFGNEIYYDDSTGQVIGLDTGGTSNTFTPGAGGGIFSPSPSNTGNSGTTSANSTVSNGVDLSTVDLSKLGDLLQKGVLAWNAQQITNANIQRAQAGLPLINPAIASPQVLGQSMTLQSFILPLGILAVALMFAGKSGNKSAQV